jgi:hypothetical protein
VLQDVVGKLKVPYYIGQGRPPMGPDGVLHTVQPSSPPRWWWALWVVWARLLMGCVPTQPAIKPLGNIKKSPAYFNCVKMTLIYAKNLLDAHRMLWGIGLGFNHGPRGTIKVFNRYHLSASPTPLFRNVDGIARRCMRESKHVYIPMCDV